MSAARKGPSPVSLIVTGLLISGAGLAGDALPVIGRFAAEAGVLRPVLIVAGAISVAMGIYSILRPEKDESRRSFGHRSR